MDNLTLIDTFVHEKRVFSSHNLNYLKDVVTHVTQCIVQISLLILDSRFLYDGNSCIK